MGNFKTIVAVIFGVGLVVGVLIFSGLIPIGQKSKDGVAGAVGKVTLWGTVKRDVLSQQLSDFNDTNKTFTVSYVEKNPITFNTELIEALASGIGPDMIMLPTDSILRYTDKIYPVPYASYPERTFRDTFITEATLYLSSKGVMAFPMTVDPMVMYYNRAIFENAGIAVPPTTWEDIVALVPTLTKRDQQGVIIQNAVALGEYDNVTNAKDVATLLMLQRGNGLVAIEQNKPFSVVENGSRTSKTPVKDALAFYTGFANPTNTDLYSWNKSFPQSRDQFIAGKLAIYFGYASELFAIQGRNPNLNFDITAIPQVKGTTEPITFGKTTGIAVLKSSKNLNTSIIAASLMSSSNFVATYVSNLSQAGINFVPARRDLLVQTPSSYYAPIIYRAGLTSRGWYDPHDEGSDAVFQQVINGINSGLYTTDTAVEALSTRLTLLFKNITF